MAYHVRRQALAVLAEVLGECGQATEAKSATQVNDLLAKLDKGASVTLQVRRGDNQFFATLKIGNGE